MAKAAPAGLRANNFILNDLQKCGWLSRNPSLERGGQVWTCEEGLTNDELKKFLVDDWPAHIVKISETDYYVIAVKASILELDKALDEAIGYAGRTNKSNKVRVKIVSGIAGSGEGSYYIRSKYFKDGYWHDITLNQNPLTSLITPQMAAELLLHDAPMLQDVPVDEQEFIRTAEEINSILHNGSIHKDYRARVISALLLSLLEVKPVNLDESPELLVQSINTRVNKLLKKEGKEAFAHYIEVSLPATKDNHARFKNALVKTLRKLDDLNIRAAFNAGTDVLGKFYEVFLKYGNGAREIGIVLTPRHITRFAAEVLDVNHKDLVYDPACGTGGFLVAAFDHVKKRSTAKEIGQFKKYRLFGVDQQDFIVALAIVNMIFRGDGQTNITEGNSLVKWLTHKRVDGVNSAEYANEDSEANTPPITKVLMNPPFSQDEKEVHFIDQALKQMQQGGLLFCILPKGIMVKQGRELAWRKQLLKEHSLLSVINFPEDLFYPTGTQTCAIIIRKGRPQAKENPVLWLNIQQDGLLKSKGKRLPSVRSTNQLEGIQDELRDFISGTINVIKEEPSFKKLCPIDFGDKNLELLPEAYLSDAIPERKKLIQSIDHTLREFLAIMIANDYTGHFKNRLAADGYSFNDIVPETRASLLEVNVSELFQKPVQTGRIHVSGVLDSGSVPLISCSAENGGVEGFFDLEASFEDAITIASDGAPLTSFYHYYPFEAKDNVIVGIPLQQWRFTTKLFMANQVNGLKWRFNYGRKCYLNKLHKINIYMPYTNTGTIDEDYIESLFRETSSWAILRLLA